MAQIVKPYRPAMPQGLEKEISVYWDTDDPELLYNFKFAVDAMLREAYNSTEFMGPQITSSFGKQFTQFLHNGMRFYNDMDAPEVCTPECPHPRSLVTYEQAGNIIAYRVAQAASARIGERIELVNKNSDWQGHTYGLHENYCINPGLFKTLIFSKDFSTVQRVLATFLLMRSILTGAGKVGVEEHDMGIAFQITQRMDFLSRFRGTSTTDNRPLFQTREQPHADKTKWQRFHYIMGDTNICQASTYLKTGLTALMLMILQDGPRTSFELPVLSIKDEDGDEDPDDLALIGRLVSWDTEMEHRFPVRFMSRYDESGGEEKEMSAPDILSYYIDRLGAYVEEREFAHTEEKEVYADVVKIACECLGLIRAGKSRQLYGLLDWPTKRGIIERLLQRKGRKWNDLLTDHDLLHYMRAVADHAFGSLDRENGFYFKLLRAGEIKTIVPEREVLHAVRNPPPGRAMLRTMIIDKWHTWIKAGGIDWNKLVMDHPIRKDDHWNLKLSDPRVAVIPQMRQAVETASDPRELNDMLKKLIKQERGRQRST